MLVRRSQTASRQSKSHSCNNTFRWLESSILRSPLDPARESQNAIDRVIGYFSGGVEFGSTPNAPTSDQLLRAMLDDADVASLASSVGCDHVLAVLEAAVSSGELSSDAMPTTCNAALAHVLSVPVRLTNAHRIHRIDLS